jgi:hypothetical protein
LGRVEGVGSEVRCLKELEERRYWKRREEKRRVKLKEGKIKRERERERERAKQWFSYNKVSKKKKKTPNVTLNAKQYFPLKGFSIDKPKWGKAHILNIKSVSSNWSKNGEISHDW